MHYPPFGPGQAPTYFTEALEEVEPDAVVYGHLHGVDKKKIHEGDLRGINYTMVACDYTDFSPVRILP